MPLRLSRNASAAEPKKAKTSPDGPVQEVLVLADSGSIYGQNFMPAICPVLDFVKIRYVMLDLAQDRAWPPLERFAAVVIITETIWRLEAEKAARIARYVESGGGLLVTFRGWCDHLSHVFGFGLAARPEMELSEGIVFNGEILPGIDGLDLPNSERDLQNSRFQITAESLDENCQILVADSDGAPVYWVRNHGAGRVAYWNTGILMHRALRGLFLHSLMDVMGPSVAATAGFAILHVDDFPCSLSPDLPEPIVNEFPDADWQDFFFGIWHRDMMALRRRHGLRFTWYAVMNYFDVDTSAGAATDSPAALTGAPVLAQRMAHIGEWAEDDEWGLHGYNHEPILADHWPDKATLRRKLQLARVLWENVMPLAAPRSWVPANNQFDRQRLQILHAVFPELTAVASTYTCGLFANGESRDFGAEPWEDSLLAIPRETFGYVETKELRLMALSQASSLGIWSHFIHPDDLLDIPGSPEERDWRRNPDGRGWRRVNEAGLPGMLTTIDRWIGNMRATYPWLEFVTTKEAERLLRAHFANRMRVVRTGNGLSIETGRDAMFQLRLPAGVSIARSDGADIIHSYELATGCLHILSCGPGITDIALTAN